MQPVWGAGCQARQRRLRDLQADNQRRRRQRDAATRAGKRQAAPFAKGQPAAQPKKPGRKPGKDCGTKAPRQPPNPQQIDEVHQTPLPDRGPDGAGPRDETPVAQPFQVEIPPKPLHRPFHIHVGPCRRGPRRVQGRHPLQTSDALGVAAAQRGPDAQAALVELTKQGGLSQGKVSRCLASLLGIPLRRGGSVPTVLRAASRGEPVEEAIRQTVGPSDGVVPDETGWRLGGSPAWLHARVGPEATASVIDPTRSDAVAEAIRGLVRDRHAAGEIGRHGLAVARGRLESQRSDPVFPAKTNAANERLAQHRGVHRGELFTVLRQPGLDATNGRAERALRFGVLLRKVGGGSRTGAGAHAPSVRMSVWRTCGQQGLSALDFLSQLLRGPPSQDCVIAGLNAWPLMRPSR